MYLFDRSRLYWNYPASYLNYLPHYLIMPCITTQHPLSTTIDQYALSTLKLSASISEIFHPSFSQWKLRRNHAHNQMFTLTQSNSPYFDCFIRRLRKSLNLSCNFPAVTALTQFVALCSVCDKIEWQNFVTGFLYSTSIQSVFHEFLFIRFCIYPIYRIYI